MREGPGPLEVPIIYGSPSDERGTGAVRGTEGVGPGPWVGGR